MNCHRLILMIKPNNFNIILIKAKMIQMKNAFAYSNSLKNLDSTKLYLNR